MKNIEIKINRNTSYVELPDSVLGISGENLQGKIIIKFEGDFVVGTAWLEFKMPNSTTGYLEMAKVGETYELPIKSSLLTQNGIINMNLRITEGTDANEIPVFKSKVFYLKVLESINSTATIPDEYPTWIDIANNKIAEIDNLDINIENNVVTITKKDGTIKSENVKGEKGEKGDAGAIKIIPITEFPTENIDESAIYVIPNPEPTSEDDKYKEFIYVNGDWEPFGGSINVDLTDYVKNTDYATHTKGGVIKVSGAYGFGISSGNLTAQKLDKTQYNSANENTVISKGTLMMALDEKFVTLTQAEYDALEEKSANTYYFIVEEE